METSAQDSTNVQTAFERVLNEIYKIATKNAVKNTNATQTASIGQGRKINSDEAEEGNKRVHLDAKKTKKLKDGKSKCC